jgi:PncC family amidohydrolase
MNKAEEMVESFRSRNLTCATAESCTGGGIGALITSVAGSSSVYLGGVISYANEVKRDVLGVSENILNTVGAVSKETAEAMALGVRKLTNADFSVSVTGIAGPGGATADKPVGLVWFGVASEHKVYSEKMIFSGDRESVRSQTAEHSLGLLMSAADGSLWKEG